MMVPAPTQSTNQSEKTVKPSPSNDTNTGNNVNCAPRQQDQTSQGGNTRNDPPNNNNSSSVRQPDQLPQGENATNGTPNNHANYGPQHDQPSQPHSHANGLHGNKSQGTHVAGSSPNNSKHRERNSSENKEGLSPTNFTPV